jgi:all-trans-retinol dehydrogenase (NAD+)
MNIYVEFVIKFVYSLFLLIYIILANIVRKFIPTKYRSKNINGEIVLITGSGSGIGRLMSIKLAKLGAKLVLVDIDKANNEKTANEIMMNGGYAKTFTCDLSDRESIYQVSEEVILHFWT